MHNVAYSATYILYAQSRPTWCSQATLVISCDLGLASIWRPVLRLFARDHEFFYDTVGKLGNTY